ncbi:MAG: helix-turn-helix transcriptional regulator [Pseudomonadota bacterium]|uniref:helix-turn-helix transcriptional regulator n=1 Tax=unclassified Phenylobacterium TaxID=2640670 RepID=UPI0006F312B8|nr:MULTISPECIES: helix-turn-helix transcriptional regulator [unclassified Phenylobacterium]KRB49490.1 hypothetical protein ASE02_16900 [Phenylobacterium sp. Root700]MBT9470070.1 helix-turn-helix transcriptional regulator [Phenylobacterium sp.]
MLAGDRAAGGGFARAAHLVLDVGKPTFAAAFSTYLRQSANIQDYMIVAYPRSPNQAPGCLLSASPAAPQLAHLYREAFYKLDPNRSIIFNDLDEDEVCTLPALGDEHYDPSYREAIFQSNGIIDKFATAFWRNDICYYVNYYRMNGQSSFSISDRDELSEVGNLLSKIVARHFESFDTGRRSPGSPMSHESLCRMVQELSSASPLTTREAQVCALILMGCSSEAIALRLDIAVNSVLTYRRRAYERLSITSQNELFAKVLTRLSASQLGAS